MEAVADADGATAMKVRQITDRQPVVDRSNDEITTAGDEHGVDVIARQTVTRVERYERLSVESRNATAPRSEIHSAVAVAHQGANGGMGKSVRRTVASNRIELRSVDEHLHHTTLPPADPNGVINRRHRIDFFSGQSHRRAEQFRRLAVEYEDSSGVPGPGVSPAVERAGPTAARVGNLAQGVAVV